jgi:MFS family permease
MVEDMGYSGNELGYHAGLLAAAFCFAQFLTAVPWGIMSDRFGRKPMIIIGTLGSGLGMLVFGSVKTFPQGRSLSTNLACLLNLKYIVLVRTAIAARMFSGLLSGNLGVVKSLLTEITDDTNRGPAFSYMSLAWAIGCVIAPLAGGMLCKPAEKYPSVFSDRHGAVFADYPYLLPCMLCSAWTVFTAVFCMVFMVETRGTKKKGTAQSPKKSLEMVKLGNGLGSDGSLSTRSGQYSTLSQDTDMDDQTSHSAGTAALYNGDSSKTNVVGNPLTAYDEELNFELHSPNTGKGNGSARYSAMQAQLQSALHSAAGDDVIHEEETKDSMETGVNSPFSPLQKQEGRRYSPVPSVSQSAHKGSFVIANDDDDEHCGEDGHADLEAGQPAVVKDNTGNGSRGGSPRSKTTAHLSATVPDAASGTGEGFEEGEDSDNDDDEELCCATCFPGEGRSSRSTSLDSSSHNLKDGGSVHGDGEKGEGKRLSTAAVLRQRLVILATGNYGMLCAAAILVDETIPLFLKASITDGGFGFNSMQIGFLLSISGAVMLVFTSFALPVISRHSKSWMFRVGTLGAIPVAISMPLIALINRTAWSHLDPTTHAWLLWTILPFTNVLKSVFSCIAFGAVMIQVNHCVYDEYLGAVNGLGQSMAALARAIGPALGGAMWSVSTQHHFVYLNFIVCAVLFVVCMYLNQLLPASLDFKKKRKSKKGFDDALEEGNAAANAPQVFH